jgi:acetyl esterase/lipase
MERFKLLAERTGAPAPADLMERREAIANAVAAGTWRTDPPPRERNFGNVRAIGFGSSSLSHATLVHFHGGGFRQGCPEMTSPYAAALAERCGVEVISPAYRLAPEHPFPAALNDGMSVLRQLHGVGRTGIWLSGDSAGGGLAASLTALCLAEQIPVAGLVLLSPLA